jgi:hypothetical protein
VGEFFLQSPLPGGSPFPLYKLKGREWIQRREREREGEREIPGIVPPLLSFTWAPLAL